MNFQSYSLCFCFLSHLTSNNTDILTTYITMNRLVITLNVWLFTAQKRVLVSGVFVPFDTCLLRVCLHQELVSLQDDQMSAAGNQIQSSDYLRCLSDSSPANMDTACFHGCCLQCEVWKPAGPQTQLSSDVSTENMIELFLHVRHLTALWTVDGLKTAGTTELAGWKLTGLFLAWIS